MANNIYLSCTNCWVTFTRRASLIKKNQRNHFCSSSCSASFNNKHRKQGKKVSKLEKWLQPRLKEAYPNLLMEFNEKTIGSELDIYIPGMKLAFEVNGRFHYEPVFSEAHLKAIKANDAAKHEQCRRNNIELVTIDARELKYLTHKKGRRYLNQITEKIDKNLQKEDD